MFFLIVLLTASLAEDKSPEEMFSRARIAGDLKTLESLLASGLNPDLRDRYGQTPLYLALTSNQTAVVDLLLTWHADPNGIVNRGNQGGRSPVTPLQAAAQSGNLRAAARLIAAGAQVNATGVSGRTALHFAGRKLDMLRFLIEKGADVNARDAEGASPLDDAVWNGSLDSLAILIAHGAHWNEADPQTGATPVNEAAFRGHTALIQFLLQFHPDIATPDKRGYSPLDNAIRMGKEDSALLLLNAEPKDGQTPDVLAKIMDAAIGKGEAIVVEGLIRRGADANLGGPNGSTPLEDASLRGFDAVAGVLLDRGASINHVNTGSGTTALYAAASFGKAKVVALLLERGAKPNLCGKNGKTPYQAAVANGYPEVAAEIRDRGGAKPCEQ